MGTPNPAASGALAVNAASGWLAGARRVASPNCDPRPPGCQPQLIVVHGISLPPGRYGGPHIDQLFCNALDAAADPYFAAIAGLKVSSHLLIARDGALTQYVPFGQRAWHAGESNWCGRTACNDFSIGIELEGVDDASYEDAQYRALARVVTALQRAYPSLAQGAIAGHSDIAAGRKTDPGPAFDWSRLRQAISIAGGHYRREDPA